MAVTKIDRVHTALNEPSEVTFTAKTGTFYVDMCGADYKTALLFKNSGSSALTVTVSVGDGIQGVGDDIKVAVAGGKTAVLTVDSGAYKVMSGEAKGTVKCSTTASVDVAVVELP